MTKTCFVIAPIGESESDTRKRSDLILKFVITPAVQECGYEPLRADQMPEPGIITSQVIQRIIDDPLVIADLTERNPNVFYELALRHAIRKPYIQIIKKGDVLPFDIAGTRTIPVDHQDLESVETAKTEIVKQIQSLEKTSLPIDSPVSVSVDLQVLKQSTNPEQRSLADLMSSVSVLQNGINAIVARLDKSDSTVSSSDKRVSYDLILDIIHHIEITSDRIGEAAGTLGKKVSLEEGKGLEEVQDILIFQTRIKTALSHFIEIMKTMK